MCCITGIVGQVSLLQWIFAQVKELHPAVEPLGVATRLGPDSSPLGAVDEPVVVLREVHQQQRFLGWCRRTTNRAVPQHRGQIMALDGLRNRHPSQAAQRGEEIRHAKQVIDAGAGLNDIGETDDARDMNCLFVRVFLEPRMDIVGTAHGAMVRGE